MLGRWAGPHKGRDAPDMSKRLAKLHPSVLPTLASGPGGGAPCAAAGARQDARRRTDGCHEHQRHHEHRGPGR
ncbi:hypothetical protein Sdagh_47310 [Streptomyces daghestanicus]|nr:hypothetical protein Sdagh_47310 [Streptomyces daghestanicus]